MKAELIRTPKATFKVAKTPDEFPLGERGKRPISVIFDDWDDAAKVKEAKIPGVLARNLGARCTWDGALAIARMLEVSDHLVEPVTRRITATVPTPGMARYRELGLDKVRKPYQSTGMLYLLRRAYAILGDPPRCLSGDTEVVVNRATVGTRMTIKALHHKFHGGVSFRGRGAEHGGGTPVRWDPKVETFTRSRTDDDFIKKNKIVDVYESGQKEVFEVVTERGHAIKASSDHNFLTPDGYRRLSDLTVGGSVMTVVYPTRKANKSRRPSDHVDGCWLHPYARKGTHRRKDRAPERVARVSRHRLVYEAELNNRTFDDFLALIRTGPVDGLLFLDPKKFDVHHKDEDWHNNDPRNLIAVPREEHLRHHGQVSHWKHVTAQAKPDRIVSIRSVGIEMTYDISMSSPYNNFVANEFVVHNSGKCLMAIMTAVISGTKKTLILCRALGKYVWGEEIAKWAREEAVLLFGRAGTEARRICGLCLGAGFTYANDGKTGESISVDCKPCGGRGELVFKARRLEVVTEGRVVYENTGKLKKDGTPRMQRRVARYCPLPARYVCPVHPQVVDSRARVCDVCRDEVLVVIAAAKWVIANYDILNAQKDKTDKGREFMRADLPGWGPVLGRYRFEMGLADESHALRGWHGKGPGQKEAATRRERACEVCADIPRVYAVTGTPIYGFTRDVWGQLDFISDGLWS